MSNQPAIEDVPEEVIIVIPESELLNLIREVAGPEADADMIYMEFWANSRAQSVGMVDEEYDCDHCECDQSADDFDEDACECICTCDYEVEVFDSENEEEA